MGSALLAKCSIHFPNGTPNTIFTNIKNLLNENDEFYNISSHPFEIHFEISGYNGIDYKPLKIIQKQSLEILNKWGISKKGFIINCSEWEESGNGYFYEFEESEY